MGKARREKNKRLRRDRQISRDRRNSIKREVANFVDNDNALDAFNVLFVLKDTDNMEEVFLTIQNIRRGFFLSLPNISADSFSVSDKASIKNVIYNKFGIRSDNIQLINNTRLIVVKDFVMNKKLDKFARVIVRPYSYYTWYRDNRVTSINGFRIYSGKELKNYFRIPHPENLFIFQDTLTKLALYKVHERKVNPLEFYETYINYRYCKPNYHSRYYDAGFAIMDNQYIKLLEKENEEFKEFFEPDNPKQKLLK
jgi:hypothetical protein